MPQYRVTFSDHENQVIHESDVSCAFAHNAPKVAIAPLTDDAKRQVYKAVSVQVVAIQQGLNV